MNADYKNFFVMILFVTMTSIFSVHSAQIEFKNGVPLKSPDGDISFANFGRPSLSLVDWDNDGLTDLLVGYQQFAMFGNVHFFKNVGTKTAPLFESKGNLQDENGDITVTGG